MLKNKLPNVLARSSNQTHKAIKRGKLHSSDTYEEVVASTGFSRELASTLSPSIVSIASFDGEKLHSVSTGILVFMNHIGTSILTSPGLVTTSHTKGRFNPRLQMKVRLPNNEVVHGDVQHYILRHRILLVTTCPFPDLCVPCFGDHMQVEPCTELLAIRRCFNSGKITVTSGVLVDSPDGVDSEGVMFSTCKLTLDGSGGPLVDLDGNIVGMNGYHDCERGITPFLPRNRFLELLRRYGIMRKEAGCSTTESSTNEIQKSSTPSNYCSEEVPNQVDVSPFPEPKDESSMVTSAECTDDELKNMLCPWLPDEFTEIVNGWLRKSGYPLPSFFDDGMYLKGDLEEGFGKDIWSGSIRRVTLKMSRSVVALASFNDKGERYFACTGVFIECNESTTRVLTSASLVRTSGDENKIYDNLRIEVCLPSKRRITGTLQHYSLHYNVAIVGINGFRSHRAAKLNDSSGSTEVVALGRVFEFGKLMATDGVLTHKQSRLDCKELQMSTCKITKAGIGGPLVISDGNLVGMNFYDMEETPYLPTNIILEIMSHFHAERTGTAGTMAESNNYRWPVPEPYWYYPSRYRGLSLNIKDEEILE